jgi:hypothetical protein
LAFNLEWAGLLPDPVLTTSGLSAAGLRSRNISQFFFMAKKFHHVAMAELNKF